MNSEKTKKIFPFFKKACSSSRTWRKSPKILEETRHGKKIHVVFERFEDELSIHLSSF
jgi:hypothetical protein